MEAPAGLKLKLYRRFINKSFSSATDEIICFNNKLLVILIIFLNVGCGSLSAFLPSSSRDRWYLENMKDTDILHKIQRGSTRNDVLREWGEPWRKKSDDIWVYWFKDIVKEKTYLKFDNDHVIKIWTSFELY